MYFGIDNHNILWYYQGKIYYGGWKMQANGEGEKHGEGIEIGNGFRFKGSFINGKRNGQGTLIT